MADRTVTLKDGRILGLATAGDPVARRIVVLAHPSPGAALFDPDPTLTQSWGVHLLCLDRPGYGSSPALTGGAVADVAHRADEVAQYLSNTEASAQATSGVEFGRIGVVGWGTGGLFALSLAARHPHLVDRIALIGTPSPLRLAEEGLPEGEAPYDLESLGIDADDPQLQRSGLRSRLERMLADAALQGSAGMDADRQAFSATEWIDDLPALTAKTLLVSPEADAGHTIDDQKWFRSNVPRLKVATVSGGGPLVIASQWDRILEHVAPRHGDVPPRLKDSHPGV